MSLRGRRRREPEYNFCVRTAPEPFRLSLAMTITLRLFGELKQYAPEGERLGRAVRIEIPDGLTARQLILRLGIPYGGEEGQMVVAVNDSEVHHEAVLRDGDAVSLFEPLAGGW